MARRRRKMTPFARFLLVMLFLVPAAFIGASLFNGEDPVQNFRSLWDRINPAAEKVVVEEAPAESPAPQPTVPPEEGPDSLEEEATSASGEPAGQMSEGMQNRFRNLEQMIEALRQQVNELEGRIEQLEAGAGDSVNTN